MSLFDPQDLRDYLTSAVTIDDPQAVVLSQIVTDLISAYVGYDVSPSASPRTVTLSLETDFTVRLPRLLDTLTSVTANGLNVRYVQHGDTITVATATFPTSWFLVWVNDRTVDVTYVYSTVPGPMKSAALLTAATMHASAQQNGSVGLLKSSQIDDFQATYLSATELFGATGLPPQAMALLRQYKRNNRSVKLRAVGGAPVGP